MVTHSSTFAWRIPWTEEPGRLQAMESQRVRLKGLNIYIYIHTHTQWYQNLSDSIRAKTRMKKPLFDVSTTQTSWHQGRGGGASSNAPPCGNGTDAVSATRVMPLTRELLGAQSLSTGGVLSVSREQPGALSASTREQLGALSLSTGRGVH